jgi:methyl-accepting chemotaxis protein
MNLFTFGGQNEAKKERRDERAAVVVAVYKTMAVIEFGLDGTIITANENFLRVMGYSLDELAGRKHSMFVDPDYASSTTYRDFWQRLNAGEAFTDKFPRVHKTGRRVWIQGSYVPMLTLEGKPYKIIKFVNDVTAVQEEAERLEAEKEAAAAAVRDAVDALSAGLAKLAAGDLQTRLSVPFDAAYERLRGDFNTAAERLGAAISGVVINSTAIRQAASEIAQTSDDLARRTHDQAGTVQQTVTAMREIASIVRQTSEGAGQAGTVLANARNDAAQSRAVLDQTVAAMTAIESSAGEIGSIIGLIDEIAFQTNLLALNAGVEAARAGDAGRGFAVVATEVRALAQRSAEAAKQIKTLISASGAQVGEGVRLVHATGEALQRIATQVGALDNVVTLITKAAGQQEGAIAAVNGAMQQLDKVTQQNAAIVEESAAASQNLAQEADGLESLIAQFKTGAPSAAPARLPPPRAAAAARPGPGKFVKIGR